MPFEDSGVSDPATGKQIAISTTLRKFYRAKYKEEYGHLANKELNKVIADEFAKCSGKIIHYFKAKSGKGSVTADWAEIRQGLWSTRFFISLYSDKMYVAAMQERFAEPKTRNVKVK